MKKLVLRIGLVLIAIASGVAFFMREPTYCNETETLRAPSGRMLSLCDVGYETQPNQSEWAVVRVLDPALSEGVGPQDHDWACETWGVPASENEPPPERIVIQFMEAPFERGTPAPSVLQSIEVYSVSEGACVWELL